MIFFHRFLKENYEVHDDGHVGGFYVKSGFCTGMKGNLHCRTISEVPGLAMALFNRDGFQEKPYVFVEPTMAHNKEIKVEIFANPHCPEVDDIVYYTVESTGSGPSFKNEELTAFVMYAKQRYVEEFGEHSAYPILRVDVFLRQDGQFVVNEFEHFEAKGENGTMEKAFLRKFWVAQIQCMIAQAV